MKRNQKHTLESMAKHFGAYKQSNLSQEQYCKQNGLAYSTFQYWLKKLKGQDNPQPGFISVKVRPESNLEIKSETNQLHFCFPNGVQMRCPDTINLNLLKQLINS